MYTHVAWDAAAATCEKKGGFLFQYDEAVRLEATAASNDAEAPSSVVDYLETECNNDVGCWLAGPMDEDEKCRFYSSKTGKVHAKSASDSECGELKDVVCAFNLPIGRTPPSGLFEMESTTTMVAYPGFCPFGSDCHSGSVCDVESGVCVPSDSSTTLATSPSSILSVLQSCEPGTSCALEGQTCGEEGVCFEGTPPAAAAVSTDIASLWVVQGTPPAANRTVTKLYESSTRTGDISDGYPYYPKLYTEGYDEASGEWLHNGATRFTMSGTTTSVDLAYVARQLSFHVDLQSSAALPVEDSNSYSYLTLQFLDIDLHNAESACKADSYEWINPDLFQRNDEGYEMVSQNDVPDDYITVLYTMPATDGPLMPHHLRAAAKNAGWQPAPCVDVDADCESRANSDTCDTDAGFASRCKKFCEQKCLAVNSTTWTDAFPRVHTPPGVLDATIVMTVHQCDDAIYSGLVRKPDVQIDELPCYSKSLEELEEMGLSPAPCLEVSSAVLEEKRGFSAEYSVAYGTLDNIVRLDQSEKVLVQSDVPTPCGKDFMVAKSTNDGSSLTSQILTFAGHSETCSFTVSAPDETSSLHFRFVGDPGCFDTEGYPDLGTELAAHPCSFWAGQGSDTFRCRDLSIAELSSLGYSLADRSAIQSQCPFSCGECGALPGGLTIESTEGEDVLVDIPTAATPYYLEGEDQKRVQHRLLFPKDGSLSYAANSYLNVDGDLAYSADGFAVPIAPLKTTPKTIATWLRFDLASYLVEDADGVPVDTSESAIAVIMDAAGCDEGNTVFGVEVASGHPVIFWGRNACEATATTECPHPWSPGNGYVCDTDVGTGHWHHVAFAINAESNEATCYINGVPTPASVYESPCYIDASDESLDILTECMASCVTEAECASMGSSSVASCYACPSATSQFPSITSLESSCLDACDSCGLHAISSLEQMRCKESDDIFSDTFYGKFTLDHLYEQFFDRSTNPAATAESKGTCSHPVVLGSPADTTRAVLRTDARPFYGSLENFVATSDAQHGDAIAQMIRTGGCDHMSGVLLCLQGGDGDGTVNQAMYWRDSSVHSNHARLAGVEWEEPDQPVTVVKNTKSTALMEAVFASPSHGIQVTADKFGAFTLEVWAASCPGGGCGHGRCVRGVCMCDTGFEGVSCENRLSGGHCEPTGGTGALVTDLVGQHLSLFGMPSDTALERRRRLMEPQGVFATVANASAPGIDDDAQFTCPMYFRSPEHSSVEVTSFAGEGVTAAGSVRVGVFDVDNPGVVVSSNTATDGDTQPDAAQVGDVQAALDAALVETTPDTPTYTLETKAGSAATFDGVSDHAILNEFELDGSGDLALDFWMKVPDVAADSSPTKNDMFEVLSYVSFHPEDEDEVSCKDNPDYTVDLRKIGLLGDLWKVRGAVLTGKNAETLPNWTADGCTDETSCGVNRCKTSAKYDSKDTKYCFDGSGKGSFAPAVCEPRAGYLGPHRFSRPRVPDTYYEAFSEGTIYGETPYSKYEFNQGTVDHTTYGPHGFTYTPFEDDGIDPVPIYENYYDSTTIMVRKHGRGRERAKKEKGGEKERRVERREGRRNQENAEVERERGEGRGLNCHRSPPSAITTNRPH
jgi:hypothetical protein